MASHLLQPHLVLIPFMAQGHLIPMTDIARVLAERGVNITIFTTPLNAKRIASVIGRAVEGGLQIRVVQLQFPSEEAGLPKGCECFDLLPSLDMGVKFFQATKLLQPPFEQYLTELKPSPTCIISDMSFPWTSRVAQKFHIPRIVFHGFCCFSLLCAHILKTSNVFDNVTSDSEDVVLPGLPDQIELNKVQASGVSYNLSSPEVKELQDQIEEADAEAYGVVVNTFEELELNYIKEYKKAKGKKVWCIGPVSLSNKENFDKAERGNKASIDGYQCLEWLDMWEPDSVIYVCLGSLTRLAKSEMIELGSGLECSNRPFIWVLGEASDEFKKWLLDDKFEERTKGKGLLIHGWAPQVLILSHPSIGGFLTHCGWNSTLEGICSGVPLLTWPAFAEQFLNEKLAVDLLKTGVSAGIKVPVYFGSEENVGVLVNRHDIKMVIDKLMDEGEEGQVRRKRAKQLSDLAKRAMEEGGSSYTNLTSLIQDVMEQTNLENRYKSISTDTL